MNWYLAVIKNYAGFTGRARRMEFWMFVLFNVIFGIVATILDRILGTTFKMDMGFGEQDLSFGYIYALYMLAVLIPGLAAAVRRLHDVGKSGWLLLIVFIPLIGAIWLLVLFLIEGTTGENKYGADPKAIANPTV